jgi:hypothetical protein
VSFDKIWGLMKAMMRLKKTERKREICMRDIGVAIGISLN